MQFKQPGPWLYAVGMVALGLIPLVAWFPGGPMSPLLWLQLTVLILAGLGLLFRRTSICSAVALSLCWLGGLVLRHIPELIAEPGQFPLWVAAAQALTFAAVAAAFVRPGLWLAARIVLGLTVVLFGGIHFLNPEIVAGLLPGWFPLPGVWPYLTGSIQIGAGVMILIGFRAPLLAFAVGLMWLSWIPLVHLPRLLATPDAAFEWTFMVTALALAGAAWSVGERIATGAGVDFQSRAR